MFCFFEGYRVSECRNAYAYFVSNTGYRFITKKKTCYAVSVPKPEGGYIRRSVGFVRIGEKKGLRKATKIRNQIGKELWGALLGSRSQAIQLTGAVAEKSRPTVNYH